MITIVDNGTIPMKTKNAETLRAAMLERLRGDFQDGGQPDFHWLAISESFCRVCGLAPITPELQEKIGWVPLP